MSDDENLELEELEESADPTAPLLAPESADDPGAGEKTGGGGASATMGSLAEGTAAGGNGVNGEESDDAIVGELAAIYDIPVQISAVLGKATLEVNQLLKLGRGAVVELDRKVGEAIDIYVNNRLVARGEVVVVDERLGVTMTEIIKSSKT